MRFVLTILLLIGIAKAQVPTTSFYTKDSDRVTLRGADTLIDFAGNYKINDNRQFVKAKKPNTQYTTWEKFWADLVQEKQYAFYLKTKQPHKVK